jgi:uncharacterized protein (DUF488 family)
VVVFTIGHSTHPVDAFVGLLRPHGVRTLVDVRTIPRSRRHPQFNAGPLAAALAAASIEYRHIAALGGLRRPRPDSVHTAWTHPAFRGYADHMETAEFRAGFDSLLSCAAGSPTAVMCAEALWWQCHRRLVADALVAGGVEVVHILASGAPRRHEITPFAAISGGRVSYRGLV